MLNEARIFSFFILTVLCHVCVCVCGGVHFKRQRMEEWYLLLGRRGPLQLLFELRIFVPQLSLLLLQLVLLLQPVNATLLHQPAEGTDREDVEGVLRNH